MARWWGWSVMGAGIGVVLGDGRLLAAGVVVNAGGPHARHVAGMAGIALPVEARRRSIFVFQCRAAVADCPLVIDTSGVWFRPEGDRFLAGWSPPDDPERLPLEVDHEQWDEVVWPALAARVPAFEAVRVSGRGPGITIIIRSIRMGCWGVLRRRRTWCSRTGSAGMGCSRRPGWGGGIAELILTGGYRTLDLSDLDVGRVGSGRKVLERNII